MQNYILDENDNPIPVSLNEYFEWQRKLPENIRTGVGFTLARDNGTNADISTVYLGSDHRWDEPHPILWETMVFCDGDDNNDCLRAATPNGGGGD